MNARKAKQLLPLITAFANGSKIQVLDRVSERWHDISQPLWTGDAEDYRVKPEPAMIFTEDQIQHLKEVRSEAVAHINASDYHLSRVESLAKFACTVLGIDAKDKIAADIVKAVVKFGTCPETIEERIQVAKANRELLEVADDYEEEPS